MFPATTQFYALLTFIPAMHIFGFKWQKQMGDDVGNQKSYISGKSDLPGSRSSTATWLDQTTGYLYLFGGYGYGNETSDSPVFLNELWLYDTLLKKWNLIHGGQSLNNNFPKYEHMPRGRKGAASCGISETVFIIFGGESKYKLNDTWIFDINSNRWMPLFLASPQRSVLSPTPRAYMAAWCLHDRLIIFGGSGMYGQVLDDMWEFDISKLVWKRINTTINLKENVHLYPKGRFGASTWFHKNKLYMFSGSELPVTNLYSQNEENLYSDLWIFDVKANIWIVVNYDKYSYINSRPLPRLMASTWVENENLVLYGGYGKSKLNLSTLPTLTYLNDIWQLKPSTFSWKQFPKNIQVFPSQNSYSMRKCCMAAWFFNHKLHLFGGFGFDARKKAVNLNDFYILSNNTEFRKENFGMHNWLQNLKPKMIFTIVFCLFGGLVFLVGASFFLKKMIDYPRHQPVRRKYDVKYSPVSDNIQFDE